MHRFAPVGAIVFVLAAAAASAQDAPRPPLPTIVTTGEGVVRRPPDQAFVTVAVETRARSPRDAQQQNAEAMSAVQQRIARANISPQDVRTTGYSIHQEFDYPNGKQTPRGYVARNGVEVRLDEVDRVGDLLDALVDAGATTVAGVRFDLEDRSGAEREALRLAVTDARARADAMAAGAGVTIERVLRVTDTVQPPVRPMPEMAMRAAMAPAPESTPVEAGLIEVHARVELTAVIR
ncbi:MAG: SIMPL domain-containing protein [Vicinamibacterales bacterium]